MEPSDIGRIRDDRGPGRKPPPALRLIPWALLAWVVALPAACAPEPPPAPDPPPRPVSADVVYRGMRVIPGDGSPPIEDAVMAVDGRVITALGPADGIRVEPGAAAVDLNGKTLIPALIDLHGHVGFQRGLTYDAANYTRENIEDHLRRYLYHGVGAIVSLGTDAGDLWQQIRRDQLLGALGGARLFTAGSGLAAPDAGPGSPALRPSAAGVTSEDEARQQVAELADRQVAFVKIWVDDRGGTVEKLAPPLYRAVIDEAHRRGLQVIAHVFDHADAEDLVAAGVDGFAHLVRDREMDDALVEAIVARDIFVMPNLGVSERAQHAAAPAWLGDPLLAETVAPAVLERHAASYAARAANAEARAAQYVRMERSLRKLHAAGAALVLGSDAGVQDHFPGFSAHRELELLVAAGLSPMDAIAIATSRPALRLRQIDNGRLAPGMRANFVVLDTNPLDDITATRRIAAVYMEGVEVDRDALQAAWAADAGG